MRWRQCVPGMYVWIFVFLFVGISLSADGPQRVRLPISPTTAMLPSCLPSLKDLPILPLPGPRLRILIAKQVQHSYTLVNQWLNFTWSCPHAFCYESQNKNPGFIKNRTYDSAQVVCGVTTTVLHSARATRGCMCGHVADWGSTDMVANPTRGLCPRSPAHSTPWMRQYGRRFPTLSIPLASIIASRSVDDTTHQTKSPAPPEQLN